MVWLITMAAVMALPATAVAHADLAASTPTSGAELEEAPDEVRLTFTDELNPDGSGFDVTDAAGTVVGRGEVDLEVADRDELAGSVTIRDPGRYTVAWSVLSSDGHEASGSFTFGYRTSEASSPDTRMTSPSPWWPTLIGFLLLAMALVVVRRGATIQ